MAEIVIALLFVAAVIAAAFFYLESARRRRRSADVPEKSIAVLPFENLSEEKANAFFTDGVQDEILTDLAKIADLKVISRTLCDAIQERRAAQPARDRCSS